MIRKLFLAVVTAAAGLSAVASKVSYTENATLTETLQLTENHEIEVAAGVTVTISGRIGLADGTEEAELKKTGAGMLVLSNAENSFSSLVVVGGVLRADAEGCLGAGQITMGGGQLRFNKKGATFANAITATTSSAPSVAFAGDATSMHSQYAQLFFVADTTLTGGITTPNIDFNINCDRKGYDASNNNWAQATFDCEINLGTANLVFPGNGSYGRYVFKKKVTCDTIDAKFSWSAAAIMTFETENAIRYLPVNSANIFVKHPCAFTNTLVSFERCWDAGRGMIYPRVDHMAIGALSADASRTGSDQYPSKPDKTGARFRLTKTNFSGDAAQSACTLEIYGDDTAGRITYARIDNDIKVVLRPTNPNYVQTFDWVASPMTGEIVVESGKLRLTHGATFVNVAKLTVAEGASVEVNSNVEGALAGLKRMDLLGGFTAATSAGNPFRTDTELEFHLGENAAYNVPPMVDVGKLFVGEARQVSATYTHENLVQIAEGSSIRVVANADEVGTYSWNGEGTVVSANASWTKTDAVYDVSENLLANGGVHPTFAAAGTEAIFDVAAMFPGIDFLAPNDFTLRPQDEEHGSITLGKDGIKVTDPLEGDNPARTYTLALPTSLSCGQAWSISPAATLCLDSALQGACSGVVLAQGEGQLMLKGTNSFSSGLTVKSGTRVVFEGLVTTADDAVSTATPAYNGTESVAVDVKVGVANQEAQLVFNGVEFKKPLWAVFGAANSMESIPSMSARAGTKNLFRAAVNTRGNNAYLNCAKNAEARFEGPFTAGSLKQVGPGTMILDNKSATPSAFENLYSNMGTNIFYGTGTTVSARFCADGDGGVGIFMNDELFVPAKGAAFVLGDFWRGGRPKATIDFNGTTQTWPCLRAETAGGVANYAVIRTAADKPARFVITGDGTLSSTNTSDIIGPVTIVKSGAKSFHTLMRHVQMTGNLEISGGLFDIAANSSYTNVPNVLLSGTATFALNANNQLSRNVVLKVKDSAKVSLADGVRQTVRELWIGDAVKPVKSGVYGGSDCTIEGVDKTYAAYFEGTGCVYVKRLSTSLVLR